MSERRVVITGLGAISSLGLSAKQSWQNLKEGKSGIKTISKFDVSNSPTKIAGVPGNYTSEIFDPEQYINPRDIKKMDLFIQYGMAAAKEAVEDSGWMPEDEESLLRTGVIISSGIGGLKSIEDTSLNLSEGKKISPFFIPSALINLLPGQVAIRYGFRGPNKSIVTACASSTDAIGDAMRTIKYGDADVIITGGAEASVTPVGLAGFSAAKTLSSKFNDTPEKASRPWDKNRDGFVMGEGSAVLVLEEYEHAKKRGAKIYAEVIGYGLSGDGYHITSPHPDACYTTMSLALKDARISPEQVGYINAHGTSTTVGDDIELAGVQRMFLDTNPKIKMSSNKSAIGHLLGGAGAMEAIFTTMSLKEQIVPPTLNLDDPVEEAKIDLVPHNAKEHKFEYALSNSFGFGGANACLVLKRY